MHRLLFNTLGKKFNFYPINFSTFQIASIDSIIQKNRNSYLNMIYFSIYEKQKTFGCPLSITKSPDNSPVYNSGKLDVFFNLSHSVSASQPLFEVEAAAAL